MALLADEKCSKFFRANYRTELTVADVRRKLLQHESWICNIFLQHLLQHPQRGCSSRNPDQDKVLGPTIIYCGK